MTPVLKAKSPHVMSLIDETVPKNKYLDYKNQGRPFTIAMIEHSSLLYAGIQKYPTLYALLV